MSIEGHPFFEEPQEPEKPHNPENKKAGFFKKAALGAALLAGGAGLYKAGQESAVPDNEPKIVQKDEGIIESVDREHILMPVKVESKTFYEDECISIFVKEGERAVFIQNKEAEGNESTMGVEIYGENLVITAEEESYMNLGMFKKTEPIVAIAPRETKETYNEKFRNEGEKLYEDNFITILTEKGRNQFSIHNKLSGGAQMNVFNWQSWLNVAAPNHIMQIGKVNGRVGVFILGNQTQPSQNLEIGKAKELIQTLE